MKFSTALTILLAFAVGGCASASHHVTPAPPTQPGAQTAATTQSPQLSNEQIAQQLLEAVNQEREKNHLSALSVSPALARSAQEHSDTMQRGAFLSTKGETEQGVFARMSSAGAFAQNGSEHTKTFIGENVLRLGARSDQLASQALAIWMETPQDRKNLLSASFTHTGIGLSPSPNGDYYITQDFVR